MINASVIEFATAAPPEYVPPHEPDIMDSFIVSVTVCFLFTVSGLPIVLDFFSNWAGESITDVIASFSFLANYSDISRGIIDFRTLVYFLSLIVLFLYLNVITLDNSRI